MSTLTGRVVAAVSHEPIPNAMVYIQREVAETSIGLSDGSIQVSRTTDAEGRFSFDELVAARYQLAIGADSQHLAARQTVEVTDANVELAEITVARARN